MNNVNYKMACVIPLGPAGRDNCMPNKEYLEFGLKLLKEQIEPVKVIIACDENIQSDRKEIIEKYADEIRWFPKHSYFAKGGIWKKMWLCWKENCEGINYVKFQGYDDYIDRKYSAFILQTLEKTKANACFCSNYNNNHGNMRKVNDGNINFKQYIGSHPMYMGGFTLKKDVILNSGMEKYIDKASYYFEGYWYNYVCRTGRIVYNPNAIFYYRDHSGTITETCREKEDWVIEARKCTGYSLEQTKKDWDSINFNKLCEETRLIYR